VTGRFLLVRRSLAQHKLSTTVTVLAAALACGLLWELWNWGSLAKWHYSLPYVQRFLVFEMPLLGYAGYLPFGLECALVMDLVARALGRPNPLTGSD
jgi:hypothetical protein